MQTFHIFKICKNDINGIFVSIRFEMEKFNTTFKVLIDQIIFQFNFFFH
jgi:hypothetical protein